MKSIIVGTAGHIDHGKTTLVRALTGVDADRLPEEKRRGITIDIGFAELDLGDARIGFVDVPGHERFIKNMLAGAHGIDAVLLVIAADEGVMPQTREHYDVCRLLGVQTGLIVITKTDAIEDELLELVRAEAEELVAGSFLAGAPIVPVSAKTGAGVDALLVELRRLAARVPARASEYVTRLPIDRAFSLRGFGAVVTGTLVAGSIAEGDELDVLPAVQRVRVRGVQVYGAAVARALAGQRTALNLGGIETERLERGMVLAPPAQLRATQIIDARLEMLPVISSTANASSSARSLRSRARVRIHVGAAEVLARVQILEEGGEIAPGASGMAQLRLESPAVVTMNERFIVRRYSPPHTIAGGRVLDNAASKYRGREKVRAARDRLETLNRATNAEQALIFINAAGEHGMRRADLIARTGLRKEVLERAVVAAEKQGEIKDAEGVLIGRASEARLLARAVDAVKAHHKSEPLARGLARETLRERVFAHVPAEVFRAVLARAEDCGALVSERDIVRTPKHQLSLSNSDVRLRDSLERLCREANLAALQNDEALARAINESRATEGVAHAAKILQLLIKAGTLVRIGELLFHRAALDHLTEQLRAYAAQHPDRLIDVAAFKDLTGVSRKYAIPLLEHLDRTRITRRAGDRRQIL